MPRIPVFVLCRIQHFCYRPLGISPVAVHPVGVGEIENPLQGDLHAFYPEPGHSARMRRFVQSLVAICEDRAVSLCQNRLRRDRLPNLFFLACTKEQTWMRAWLGIRISKQREQEQSQRQDSFHIAGVMNVLTLSI